VPEDEISAWMMTPNFSKLAPKLQDSASTQFELQAGCKELGGRAVEEMDGEDEEGAGMAVTMTKLNKRPKGQLRKKRADSDEEGGGAKGNGARITLSGASAVVKKVKKVAEEEKSSLSFDTEEAGDVEEDAFASKKRAAGPEVLTFFTGPCSASACLARLYNRSSLQSV